MRLPGLAWLELGIEDPAAQGTTQRRGPSSVTTYVQRAVFHPRGLLGHAYWWSVAPFHGIVFGGMSRNIARAAEQLEAGEKVTTTPI